ncbi:hypothetical protein RB597_002269 [Gaeumannomyces tritici]
MPPSTPSSQLRRQLWAAVRDSAAAALGRRPRLQPASSLPSCAGRPSPHPPSITGPLHSPPRFAPGHVRRSCTSGSLLLLGLSSPSSSPTQTVVASCTAAAAADAALGSPAWPRSKSGFALATARQAWRRGVHTGRGHGVQDAGAKDSAGTTSATSPKRPESRIDNDTNPAVAAQSNGNRPGAPEQSEQPILPQPPLEPESLTDSMSKYLHLPHLPKMPHRPSKEELLSAANGFWERFKVRFKWLSIRSMRPYNADEWGAFVSWFMLGNLMWILVGTTTFFSLIILLVNTVLAQETLAKKVGDYLTKSAGVTVVFESAIVPRWKDGVITFRNVFVSRRPGQLKSSVKKGSSTNAAAEAAAAARQGQADGQATEVDDGNYTQFDVTINTVNVTLSFYKWWNGTGLLKDVEVKGVRGVMDRTSVRWPDVPMDPLSYRHEHQPGDFEIEHFKLEDLLVTVHQPNGFRPFPVSIYSCELPQLRKRWLFHDFLYANHMSGSFDGSLFTIHPRQIHGVPTGDHGHSAEHMGESGAWKKFSRMRIDGLKIDHLNRGVQGPFGWIYEGNVDMVADLMFPADEEDSIGKVVSEFYEKMEDAVSRNRYIRILDKNLRIDRTKNPGTFIPMVFNTDSKGHVSDTTSDHVPDPTPGEYTPFTPSSQLEPPPSPSDDEPPRYLVMDLRVHLNDVRAAVPLFTQDISYIKQPLVRPIVAYINAKRTYIPISCRIVKRISDLDGSWTVYDCGMMDDLSAEVYDAFARDVEDQHSRVRRLKKVGFWTLSMVVHALLAGVAGDLI